MYENNVRSHAYDTFTDTKFKQQKWRIHNTDSMHLPILTKYAYNLVRYKTRAEFGKRSVKT